jgi:hypothetical protein
MEEVQEGAGAPQKSPLTEGLVTESDAGLQKSPLTDGLYSEEGGASSGAEAGGASVPEAPEGYDLGIGDLGEADAALAAEYKRTAHGLGLTRDQASKLARMYGQRIQAEGKRFAEEYGTRLANQVKAWNDELGARPDLGAVVDSSRKALARYGDKEFIGLLETSGLGSHPAFVRFVSKVGMALGEPAVTGSGAASGPNYYEDAFWGAKGNG